MTGQPLAQNTAITIGNFDGVHVGHAALVRAARACVDGSGRRGRVVVLVIDPHPMTVLKPNAAAPPRLTTLAQRRRRLIAAGADEVIALRPSHEFLAQSPEQFVTWCVEQWRPSVIVEGADFRFGHGRQGTMDTLRSWESRFGYHVVEVDPVDVVLCDQSQVRASSTLTRWLLARGRVRDAAVMLGAPYEVESRVVRGDQRGRTIGFPTANLAFMDQLLPADGIYAGIAHQVEGDERWLAAISIGTKPTFGQRPRTCEAYLLDYDGPADEYDWIIRMQFTHWLRDQLTYPDASSLIAQMHRDVQTVRDLHSHMVPGLQPS